MTKYINADSLKIQIACVYGSNPKYLRWLNDAPAADVVPIEWILKWKEKFENAYSDEYDPTVAEMLVDMLEDWREENDDHNNT